MNKLKLPRCFKFISKFLSAIMTKLKKNPYFKA